MSCQSLQNNLPIIKIKFGDSQFDALLDTGANLSLVQPNILEEIKENSKVEYISRAVKIHTLNKQIIPYLSAVNLKFKIQSRWFKNQFFVTQDNWQANYQIILGYDFLQRNHILIDIHSKRLVIDNNYFPFEESLPNHNSAYSTCNTNKKSRNKNQNAVRVCNNITILPRAFQLVKLKIPEAFHDHKEILLSPNNNSKQNYSVTESLHTVSENKFIYTIIENNSREKIILRKNSKIGCAEALDEPKFIDPENETILQVNNLNLTEITQLRKEELKENDFELDHLCDNERKEVLELLMKNYSVFSKNYKTLGSTNAVTPELKLLHKFPIQTKPYSIPKIAKDYAQKEISKLLEAGIIEPSSSSYSFPVLFVKKKTPPGKNTKDLKWRMVVDYRLLNSITEAYKICLPKINDILHSISGKNLYCVLDLKSAFFQIQMQDADKDKLAFCCEIGNFQPTRLPFGAKNSTSYFHTLISKCLNDIKGQNVQFFLDDIIVAADTMSELKALLQKVFDRLKKFNLTLDPAKLQLCKKQITYLGFNVNKNGFSPSEENISKLLKFPIPKNVKQVQTFIGMVNYFRHMIYDYAEITKPIVNLTKKNVPFIWNQECQKAFDNIQDLIMNKPNLKNLNQNLPLYLATDASKTAICGILMQKHNEKFYPVEFYSKQLSPAETRYPSIRRELFAIYASTRHFYEQLYGKKFTILTDAKPLTYHLQLDKQPDIVARWLLYMQQFDYIVEHIPGIKNPADFLSRVTENSLSVNNVTLFACNDELSHEKIKLHQQKDSTIKEIIEKIKANDQITKNKYFIDSYTNLIMIKLKPQNHTLKNMQIENKILMPTSLIKNCLEIAHAPHFGTQKTYEFLTRKYFWRGMYTDAKNFCNNCSKCLENKPKPKNTIAKMIPKSNLAPGEFLAIDIVGKLPRSPDNKHYILTIIDHYSRYLEAIPVHNTASSTIIKCLNEYFSRFGIPKILLSDNGTNFCSNEFETFLKNLKIEHRKSSIYHPRSNGLVERVHKTMKESIASLSDKVISWPDRLLFFKLHYNSSKHVVTQFTPAEIFFGRSINIPLDYHDKPKHVEDLAEYAKNVQMQLEKTKQQIIENEEKYINIQSKYLKGRAKPNMEIGDKVFLQEFQHSNAFEPKYTGPWEIQKIFRNDNYLIKMLEKDKEMVKKVHISKIFIQQPLRPNIFNDGTVDEEASSIDD